MLALLVSPILGNQNFGRIGFAVLSLSLLIFMIWCFSIVWDVWDQSSDCHFCLFRKNQPVLQICARVEASSGALYKIFVLQGQVFVKSFKLFVLSYIGTNPAWRKTFKGFPQKHCLPASPSLSQGILQSTLDRTLCLIQDLKLGKLMVNFCNGTNFQDRLELIIIDDHWLLEKNTGVKSEFTCILDHLQRRVNLHGWFSPVSQPWQQKTSMGWKSLLG